MNKHKKYLSLLVFTVFLNVSTAQNDSPADATAYAEESGYDFNYWKNYINLCTPGKYPNPKRPSKDFGSWESDYTYDDNYKYFKNTTDLPWTCAIYKKLKTEKAIWLSDKLTIKDLISNDSFFVILSDKIEIPKEQNDAMFVLAVESGLTSIDENTLWMLKGKTVIFYFYDNRLNRSYDEVKLNYRFSWLF